MKIRISGNVRNVKPVFVGDGQTTKVIASVGVSSPSDDVKREIEKAKMAEKYGASAVIDHSLVPEALDIQKRIASEISVPFSVIPVYNAATMVKNTDKEFFERDDVMEIIEDQARVGADMITIHGTVLTEDIDVLENSNRLIPCTSRGGTMVIENMLASEEENPFWRYFDDILSIAKHYDLTISLGSIFRPASVADFVENDSMFWVEVERQAILVKKAINAGVSIMVEGIGHASIDRIPNIIKKTKRTCHGAPYRVLSVSTDIALGFDHVSSAIAGAVAAANGADVITAVTRSEHIGLPDVDEVIEAVVAAQVAAHSGDLAKIGNYGKDQTMSRTRNIIGCKGSVSASICPLMTQKALEKHNVDTGDKKCTMCGDFCALTSVDRINSSKMVVKNEEPK